MEPLCTSPPSDKLFVIDICICLSQQVNARIHTASSSELTSYNSNGMILDNVVLLVATMIDDPNGVPIFESSAFSIVISICSGVSQVDLRIRDGGHILHDRALVHCR